MSYEVYIDVVHHPKHLGEFSHLLQSAGKYTEPSDAVPDDAARLRTVTAALREMADSYDPDHVCSNCSEPRHAHHGYPDRLVRCFNQYGPVAQSAWWSEPVEGGVAS